MSQNKKTHTMSFIGMVVNIGFFGGVFWSILAYLAYLINFTDIHPHIVLEPWAIGTWKNGWIGTVFSIIVIGIFSIVAALIYYFVLRRIKGIWGGIFYGAVLFILVFYLFNPLFPGIAPFSKLGKTTIVTSVCFYILYGLFVGYSISFEENEIRNRINKRKEATSQ